MTTSPSLPSSPATGAVRAWLRVEALALALAAVALYAHTGAGWGRFAALFLVPDLSLLGYLVSARTGAWIYNTAHAAVGPMLLGAISLLPGWEATLPLACIWAAHVGFDRVLGYGLKYETAFGDTHLGVIGRPAPAAALATT